MKIKTIITGATGMVGEGVLLECLNNPDVEQVLVINRKPGKVSHSKLKEIIQTDLFNLESIESQLIGYNACFFCLGISSVGISTEEYKLTTFDLTMSIANVLTKLDQEIVFCYVSGAGTDSTGKGMFAWARIKGATENSLMQLFKKSYMFRPAFLKATFGQKNVKNYYKYFSWLYQIGRMLYPAGFCTLQELGQAMINAVSKGYDKQILEVKDIVKLARS